MRIPVIFISPNDYIPGIVTKSGRLFCL